LRRPGTALFDVVKRNWSSEMADALGLDRSILPQVYESAEVTGKVRYEDVVEGETMRMEMTV